MDEFLKMDVFFMVTTASVLILTALVGFLVVRLMRVLATIERIVDSAEKEAERVREDIQDLRTKARKEGLQLRHILGFLGGIKKPKRRSKS